MESMEQVNQILLWNSTSYLRRTSGWPSSRTLGSETTNSARI